MKPNLTNTSESAAESLRVHIAEVFRLKGAGRIVFCPGILAGLRVVAASANLRKLVLTDEEYFSNAHFPHQQCQQVEASKLVELVIADKPDVVLASVVSWRGRLLGVGEAFRKIRLSLGERAPLLVADCSHAGAAGFPSAGGLGADVVCGDPSKWLLPPSTRLNIGFLWFRSQELFNALRPAFAPFFLASTGSWTGFQSRWVDAGHMTMVARALRRKDLSRTRLVELHNDNMHLAGSVIKNLGADEKPETSLLWLPKRTRSLLLTKLKKCGLVWEVGDGLRVMCRADLCG